MRRTLQRRHRRSACSKRLQQRRRGRKLLSRRASAGEWPPRNPHHRHRDVIGRRAIADIERLQSEVAAERAQQQQQALELRRAMQADIDALHASLTETETQRDAAIGRASLMKEQVTGWSHQTGV